MSAIFYIASDYPLKEVPNPHLKTLSVNEALAVGIEDIPEQLLESGFDRDKPDVLLCSDIIDTQSQLDDDFSIWPLTAPRKIFIRRSSIEFTWSGTIRKAGRKE